MSRRCLPDASHPQGRSTSPSCAEAATWWQSRCSARTSANLGEPRRTSANLGWESVARCSTRTWRSASRSTCRCCAHSATRGHAPLAREALPRPFPEGAAGELAARYAPDLRIGETADQFAINFRAQLDFELEASRGPTTVATAQPGAASRASGVGTGRELGALRGQLFVCLLARARLLPAPDRRARLARGARRDLRGGRRCGRDAAEMRPRCSRDAAEMQPRCSRDAAEMRPRCSRDAAEMFEEGRVSRRSGSPSPHGVTRPPHPQEGESVATYLTRAGERQVGEWRQDAKGAWYMIEVGETGSEDGIRYAGTANAGDMRSSVALCGVQACCKRLLLGCTSAAPRPLPYRCRTSAVLGCAARRPTSRCSSGTTTSTQTSTRATFSSARRETAETQPRRSRDAA